MERLLGSTAQVPIEAEHLFHAGMYARTVRIPKGTAVTGVLIKRDTVLVVNGVAVLATENGPLQLEGYRVLGGEAGRKTVLLAITEVEMTMVFPTQAKTVDEAEREFTDECDALMSRKRGEKCQD